MRPLVLAAFACSACLATASARAAEEAVTTYDVRFAGIRIATSRVATTVRGSTYRMDFSSDYSVLIYSGRITGTATGRIEGDRERLRPASFTLGATGDQPQRSTIGFVGNVARRIAVEPALPPDWNQGRVQLRPQHSRNVLDPISGVLFAAMRAGGDERSVCRTTVPVFSGVSRFDVVLSPAEGRVVRAAMGGRRQPDVISCRIRFVPIAGHRPTNATIRALVEATGMRVDFDREATNGFRAPRRIEIPTRYGTVAIQRTS
jgi:hypothetical protein